MSTDGILIGQRRLQISQALAARTRDARTVAEACAASAEALAADPADLPFAVIYRLDPEGAVVAGAAGIDAERCDPALWPIDVVARSGCPQDVALPAELVGCSGAAEGAPTRAVVLPVRQPGGDRTVAVLVAAVGPCLPLDEAYRDFLTLLTSQIGAALAGARALEEAEARAKTAFFNDGNHELRTPLPLGPVASVFEHAPVGVAILRGPDLVFEFVNRAYATVIGGREVVGLPIRAALPELAGQNVVEVLEDVYATGNPYVGRSVRVNLVRGGGLEDCYFDFVYQPLRNQEGAMSGISVVAFEVTELVRARREAEAASRAKDEFLAMLGHELRNPLAPILTALQMMRLRGVSGAERERAVIERQVRHLVGLVDDLLDVSRIARGKVQLRRERVDLADVVAEAVEMTSPALEEQQHVLTLDVPRGVTVIGDPGRLAQVVANLLSNAAKYSDPGGRVTVRVRADGGTAELEVADRGVGIASDMLPRVFELFTQERQDIDRSQGGLGLGLAIVHSLVVAHGGSVSAHSDGKGHGATFRVRLPLAACDLPAAPPTQTPLPPRAVGRRVLVVDDNVDAARMLGEVLRRLGHVTRVAFDGPAALEAMRTFAPQVVLLDLGLPVMDGFEVARRIRADPQLEGVEIVAVSGYGQESDRQRTEAAGFDAHLVKPVDLDRLAAVVSAGASGPLER